MIAEAFQSLFSIFVSWKLMFDISPVFFVCYTLTILAFGGFFLALLEGKLSSKQKTTQEVKE